MPPIISVITPVYNRADLVTISMESLLVQSFADWEMLIIDDGSSDNTVEIINQFVAKDARIKVFIRDIPIKGGNACRNIGLRNAKGKYVIFLDSDDKLSPFCLQQRFSVAEQHPDYDFWVFPGIRTPIDGDKNDPDNFLISTYDGKDNALDAFMRHDFLWQTTGPMYKRESLVKNQMIFDERIKVHQDVLFHITVLCRGLSFYIPLTVLPDYYWFVHHAGHTGTTVNVSILDSNLLYVDLIMEELTRANLFKKSYTTFFVDFLLKDLARYGVYHKSEKNVDSILKVLSAYRFLSEKQIRLLRRISHFIMCIPSQAGRRKALTLYRLLFFEKNPPPKFFLSKHVGEFRANKTSDIS